MKTRHIILHLLAGLLLFAFCGELATDVLSTEHEQSIVLFDSELEDEASVSKLELIPSTLIIARLFHVFAAHSISIIPNCAPSQRANLSPHGYKVPIFIDACVHRI